MEYLTLAGIERAAKYSQNAVHAAQATCIAQAMDKLISAKSLTDFASAYKAARIILHASTFDLGFSLADFRFNQIDGYTEMKIVGFANCTEEACEDWIPA